MEFSEKLRFYRKEAGLTQLELANRLGVTQGLIVQYETKQGSGKQAVRPKIDKIIAIAKILNINPSDLLDSENTLHNSIATADNGYNQYPKIRRWIMVGIQFNAINLKRHLSNKGIGYQTLSYLLEQYGEPTSVPTIKKWFVKTNPLTPNLRKIKALSEILEIPADELIEQDMFDIPNAPADIVTIPKLNILADAGSEGVFDIELLQSDKSISVSREIIGKLNPTNLKVVEIVGDSMKPEFYEGDLAIIDMVNHRYDFVKIAGIYIVRTQETIYIKKLDFLPKGGVKLISINKSYGDIILNSDDDFEILGKVCGRIHISKGLVFNNQGIF